MKKKKNKKFHMDFGSRVRTIREQAGLTREQLAEMIERSPTFVADVERGSVSSDRLLWDKISKTSFDERLQFLDEDYIPIIDKAIQNQIALIRLAERKNSGPKPINENTEPEQTQD